MLSFKISVIVIDLYLVGLPYLYLILFLQVMPYCFLTQVTNASFLLFLKEKQLAL